MRSVLPKERLLRVLLKIIMVPLTEIAPMMVDIIHTIVRRIAIIQVSPYLLGSGWDSNRGCCKRQQYFMRHMIYLMDKRHSPSRNVRGVEIRFVKLI